MVMKALAKNRQRHMPVVNQVARLLLAHRLNEQDVGNVANALATLNIAHKEMLTFFQHILLTEPAHFWKPQGLANLLNALAKFDVELSDQAVRKCVELTTETQWERADHVATIANAMSKLEKSEAGLQLLPLEQFMPDMTPQGQALVLNACARVMYEAPQLFARTHFAAFFTEKHEQHVALVIHAFGRLRMRHSHEPELEKLAASRNVADWSMQGLSNVGLSLASLGLDANKFVDEAERRVGTWTEPQHSANTALASCLIHRPAHALFRDTLRLLEVDNVCKREDRPYAGPVSTQLWQVAMASGVQELDLRLRELQVMIAAYGPPNIPISSPFQSEVTKALRNITKKKIIREALVVPYVIDIVLL